MPSHRGRWHAAARFSDSSRQRPARLNARIPDRKYGLWTDPCSRSSIIPSRQSVLPCGWSWCITPTATPGGVEAAQLADTAGPVRLRRPATTRLTPSVRSQLAQHLIDVSKGGLRRPLLHQERTAMTDDRRSQPPIRTVSGGNMCQHQPWRSAWPAWRPWPPGGATVSQMSRVKAQRARENSAHVRKLLMQRQPEFAAALACAEQDFF